MQDHVFTVGFRKQPTEDNTADILMKAAKTQFSNAAQLAKLSKELIAGSNCEMICHMVEIENNLGRSLVIDLASTSANKFR